METEISLKDLLDSEDPRELVEALKFEQGMSLLEQLCASIESGGLSLDSAVGSYERGIAILQHLKAQLEKAEARIEELAGQ